MKKRYIILIVLVIAVILISQLNITRSIKTTFQLKKYWQENYTMVPPGNSGKIEFTTKLISSAPTDECFFSVGNPDNYYSPTGVDCDECTEKGGKLKANQSYIWSMTKAKGNLFYGTVSNYLCQAMMYYERYDSIHNDCRACEWEASKIGMSYTNNDFYGDYRPPLMFAYKPDSKVVVDITPFQDENLSKTLGIRAAGSCKNLVLMAGPGMGDEPGKLKSVFIYVFRADNFEYLGSYLLDDFLKEEFSLTPDNVRRCVTINDVLYIGLSAKNDEGKEIGIILRWDANPEDPFTFRLVGKSPYPFADLCEHNNRIYAQSWPSLDKEIEKQENPTIQWVSSVIMSPIISPVGLTENDAENWKKVWDYSEYDPDELTSMGYIGGAMVSFNGYLYFGNFHFPMANLHLFKLQRDSASTIKLLNAALATHRANAVFRCADFSIDKPEVDLVCGMEKLPAWNNEKEKWEIVPNKLGKKPLSGQMGMWNPFNHYTWSMEVHNDMLFIGSKSFFRTVPSMASGMGNRVTKILQKQIDKAGFPKESYTKVDSIYCPAEWLGGDLFALTKTSNELIPVTTTGFDNPFNYGMRNLISIGDCLYAGTANPYNLAENGGYELYQVKIQN